MWKEIFMEEIMRSIINKFLSLLLTLVMVVGLLAGGSPIASASESVPSMFVEGMAAEQGSRKG